MRIRSIQPQEQDQWLRMRAALWPEDPPQRLAEEISRYWTEHLVSTLPTQVLVAERADGRLGGLVEVSLRDLADGCRTSPVGYIEAWYVDEDLRRTGAGGALLSAAEDWARQQGCREMASDCVSGNHVSHRAHEALGYEHTDICLLFRKQIAPIEADERDWIGLMANGLWVGTATKLVTDPAAGGIDIFIGTTRGEMHPDGRRLVALDYEAYPEMARAQMRDLAQRARQRWPIVRQAILHRTGRVELGEPSVVIAVSAPHRAEAFEACRWLIDTLKREVAIWKREVWSDGSGTWVGET